MRNANASSVRVLRARFFIFCFIYYVQIYYYSTFIFGGVLYLQEKTYVVKYRRKKKEGQPLIRGSLICQTKEDFLYRYFITRLRSPNASPTENSERLSGSFSEAEEKGNTSQSFPQDLPSRIILC